MLQELVELGVPAHTTCTVVELRTVLMEARSMAARSIHPRIGGRRDEAKCNLSESAKIRAGLARIVMPAKPTRGWLLLWNLRQSKATLAETGRPGMGDLSAKSKPPPRLGARLANLNANGVVEARTHHGGV